VSLVLSGSGLLRVLAGMVSLASALNEREPTSSVSSWLGGVLQ
jgi:hypothetical protein